MNFVYCGGKRDFLRRPPMRVGDRQQRSSAVLAPPQVDDPSADEEASSA
jgi:hypothetical protein